MNNLIDVMNNPDDCNEDRPMINNVAFFRCVSLSLRDRERKEREKESLGQ